MTINTPAIAGTAKSFIMTHPLSIALVGGALVGTGSYYLLKKMFNKDTNSTETAEAATA